MQGIRDAYDVIAAPSSEERRLSAGITRVTPYLVPTG